MVQLVLVIKVMSYFVNSYGFVFGEKEVFYIMRLLPIWLDVR